MEISKVSKNSNGLSKRNYGIDLYKIFSMYMIVVIHILNAGGVINACDTFSVNNFVSRFMLICVYSAPDCFALASGYIMINTKYKFSRIINLWLQACFYGLIMAIVFMAFMPQVAGFKDVVKAFLPITFSQNWYLTSYFILFLFIPFINYVINGISKKSYQILVVALIIVFSVLYSTRLAIVNVMPMENGYSVWWLTILYVIGGYFGKYGNDLKIKSWFLWLAISVCVLIVGLYEVIGILGENSNGVIAILSKLAESIELLSYTSPAIILIAISLLLLFSKIELKNKAVIKIVAFFSPLAFGVCLVHAHPLVYDNILTDSCTKLAEMNTLVMVLAILGIALVIFIVCAFIDYLRVLLFKFLKVNQRTEQLCNFVSKKFLKLEN